MISGNKAQLKSLVNALMRLFVNRTDTYAVQKEDGSYRRINKPLTEEVIRRHLRDKITVGCYQIDPTDNSVRWICLDIDPEKIDEPAEVASKIFEQARTSFGDKAVLLEASRYPDQSYHVWIFLEPNIPATVAKHLGKQILKVAEIDVELFPKQEKIGEGEFGNLVKLPLGLHREHKNQSCFLDPSSLNPIQANCVLDVVGITISENEKSLIKELVEKEKDKWLSKRETKKPYRGRPPACIKKLLKGVKEGNRNEAGIRLACYLLNFCGFDANEAWGNFRKWNHKNKPPVDCSELKSIFNSALRTGYIYGCDDTLLRSLCIDQEHCPLRKEREPTFDQKIVELAKTTDVLNEVIQHLSGTVKKDETLKRLLLLIGISAFSGKPLNLFLKAPSSTGKTYNAVEALKYFPKKNLWHLGGLSPTALVHSYGVYDENKKATVVELENKILVFLESPHYETYMTLRPILSHDKHEIEYKFTGKSKKGKLKTETVIIRGWPATVFCTSKAKYIEDLATRGFTVTPEMSQEKYGAAVKLEGKREAFPFKFAHDEKIAELEELIKFLIHTIKTRKLEVITPYAEPLAEVYPHTLPRDMRDFKRFLALVKMAVFFNAFQRPALQVLDAKGNVEKAYVIATKQDYEKASEITIKIFETTRIGLPGHVIDFFNNVIVPLNNAISPITYKDLTKRFPKVYGNTIGRSTLKTSYVDPLEQVGWIEIEQDTADKRKKNIVIKKTASFSDSFQKEFSEFFDEKKLKKWFEDAGKYFDKKPFRIVKSIFDETDLSMNCFSKTILCQNNSDAKTTGEKASLKGKSSKKASVEILKENKAKQTTLIASSTSKKRSSDSQKKTISSISNKSVGCCFLCNKPLPKELKNTTTLDGNPVHLECFIETVYKER